LAQLLGREPFEILRGVDLRKQRIFIIGNHRLQRYALKNKIVSSQQKTEEKRVTVYPRIVFSEILYIRDL